LQSDICELRALPNCWVITGGNQKTNSDAGCICNYTSNVHTHRSGAGMMCPPAPRINLLMPSCSLQGSFGGKVGKRPIVAGQAAKAPSPGSGSRENLDPAQNGSPRRGKTKGGGILARSFFTSSRHSSSSSEPPHPPRFARLAW
jgi:hypothetical protein